jgi:hypothetical protein
MNFRERIEQRRNNQYFTEPANVNYIEESFESDYFGIENLRNPLACIDLRPADGNRKAIPYIYIQEINFDATDGIEIITTTKRITIIGRDLSKLYDYLTVFRVKYIQVNIGTDANQDGLFVKEILIQEL